MRLRRLRIPTLSGLVVFLASVIVWGRTFQVSGSDGTGRRVTETRSFSVPDI